MPGQEITFVLTKCLVYGLCSTGVSFSDWHCPCASGWCGWWSWCWKGSWPWCTSRRTNASGSCRLGRASARCWWPVTAGKHGFMCCISISHPCVSVVAGPGAGCTAQDGAPVSNCEHAAACVCHCQPYCFPSSRCNFSLR